jgi:hypothetical protein
MNDPLILFYKIRGAKAQRRVLAPETFSVTYGNLKALGATILVDVSRPMVKEKAA